VLWPYRFISWWWRKQLFSCFCISRKSSSEQWLWFSFSCSTATTQVCCDLTTVCRIASKSRLSCSSWLQATHTSAAYRPGKAVHILMGRRDARACQINTNYCYLETGFYLFVEYSLDVRAVVLHVHFWYDIFCKHNLINCNRIILKLSIVNFSTNRRREKWIVQNLAVASAHYFHYS
jgi:hypothetical protein